jgi:steroid delta-isomerase-like uncharacterized protein
MSEDAKSLLRRFYAEATAGNLDAVDELVADDFIDHEEFPGIEPDKEGLRKFLVMFRTAFPDARMEPHEMLADGDLVSCRATYAGTQQGEFMGVPPTGRQMDVEALDIMRIRAGRFVEHWGVMDAMAMMQQLGALPPPRPRVAD